MGSALRARAAGVVPVAVGVAAVVRHLLRREVDKLDERAADVDGDVADVLRVLVRQHDAGRVAAAAVVCAPVCRSRVISSI
jgi:hypothetical protein